MDLSTALTTCPEPEIPSLLTAFEWTYPKGDFAFWIPVLNRFDGILESAVQKHDLKHLQATPFEKKTKEALLSVLGFTKVLWDNCTNRNFYSSYEVRRRGYEG